MIIAGDCLCVDSNDFFAITANAEILASSAMITRYRCKLWGGGTTFNKYYPGVGIDGIETLVKINDSIMAGTEVQTPEQVRLCKDLSYIWIGARNCFNYSLLDAASKFHGDVFIKRGYSMSTQELIDIHDLFNGRSGKKPYFIDRGILTFDTAIDDRFDMSIKNTLTLKYKRPDIFNRLVIDCSHGVSDYRHVFDVYKAFKAVGCEQFMFECTTSGDSLTDNKHMIKSLALINFLENYK